MKLTAEDIEQLFKRGGSSAKSNQDGTASTEDETRLQRVELLAPVLASCQEAWTERSPEMALIAEKVGDGSRDAAWREPFGDSGILDFFLGILASSEQLAQALQIHILRLVGNSCADTDENRSRIVKGNHLPLIIEQLKSPHLIPYAVPVLFNIMVDYEPAQLLASESRLNQQLTYLLSSPEVAELAVFVPFICKILALLITQECEPALANPETVDILLSLALTEPASNDVDDFTTLVSVALSYLANEAFQANMIAEPHFKRFLSTFHRAHTHFDPAQVEADDADSAEQLRKLRKALVVSLCDMTGRDEFAGLHYSSSPQQQQQQQQQSETVGTLLEWLRSGNAQLQAPACLALGNVSRSDEVSTSLVQTRAHAPLEAILSDHAVSDAQLLHSALSFLKNLAVPAQNKLLLTGLLEPSCLPRIMGVDASPQVQFAAVSLTRLLLVNCPANAAQVCRPSDDSSDGVDSILALYKRSDAEPTRLEAARAIASICRVLHTSAPAIATATAQPGADGGEQARQFYDKHGSATEPLAFLITQAKWPILRSEAWFVFALMSRSREGAAAVARILAAEGTKEVLYRAITGRDMPASDQDEAGASGTQIEEGERSGEDQVSALMGGMELEPKQVDPKQKESMARVDRENALVMCTELLRTWEKGADAADGGLSPLLRDLVKEGTEMIAAQKS